MEKIVINRVKMATRYPFRRFVVHAVDDIDQPLAN